jgi:hypothetical protein
VSVYHLPETQPAVMEFIERGFRVVVLDARLHPEDVATGMPFDKVTRDEAVIVRLPLSRKGPDAFSVMICCCVDGAQLAWANVENAAQMTRLRDVCDAGGMMLRADRRDRLREALSELRRTAGAS